MPTFHEDGLILDVTVLENNSDMDCERYKLRVNSILQSSSICKDPDIGEEFTVEKRKNYGCCGGMWHLFNYDSADSNHV